jgi:hypothetical protein
VKRDWSIGVVESWSDAETVKTVELGSGRWPTPLKQGVNEMRFVFLDKAATLDGHGVLSCVSSISWLIPK